ncbi:SGNH/GDSL hydrolase family protein [Chryseobacterium sp. CT-SW4]|uniref:SGNH/GDSL hydrolase family protein n=1 Tax=Chryseobacterium sp. SW-1 TaxID=3157343 RepID=UPI003B02DCD9
MAKKAITELKEYFKAGKRPTENQFGDLIDSFIHQDAPLPENVATIDTPDLSYLGSTYTKDQIESKLTTVAGTAYLGELPKGYAFPVTGSYTFHPSEAGVYVINDISLPEITVDDFNTYLEIIIRVTNGVASLVKTPKPALPIENIFDATDEVNTSTMKATDDYLKTFGLGIGERTEITDNTFTDGSVGANASSNLVFIKKITSPEINLKTIVFTNSNITNTNGFYLIQYRLIGANYIQIDSINMATDKSFDVSVFDLQIGDYLAVNTKESSTGTYRYKPNSSSGYKFKSKATPGEDVSTILPSALLNYAYEFSLKYIYFIPSSGIAYIPDYIEKKIAYSESVTSRKIGKIVYQNFRNSTTTNNWTLSGFSSTAEGLVSTSTGINTYAEYQQYSNLDSFSSSFKFKLTSLGVVLLTNHHKKNTLPGHTVTFDFINKNVRINQAINRNVVPTTILKTFKMSFNPTVGETEIIYVRNGMKEKYIIKNSGYEDVFEYDTQGSGGTTGAGYDRFGITCYSGAITVLEAFYGSNLPAEPDVLILGDSIVNGDTIRTLDSDSMGKRWAGRIAGKTLTSIVSLGGNTTADFIRDNPFYLSLFRPKKVIFGFGINDTNYSNSISNIETLKAAWEGVGAEVILITLHPRADRLQYCADFSDYVKNSNMRYIDYRKVLTINGEGTVLNTSLLLSDNLHPNILGHNLIGQEAASLLKEY